MQNCEGNRKLLSLQCCASLSDFPRNKYFQELSLVEGQAAPSVHCNSDGHPRPKFRLQVSGRGTKNSPFYLYICNSSF